MADKPPLLVCVLAGRPAIPAGVIQPYDCCGGLKSLVAPGLTPFPLVCVPPLIRLHTLSLSSLPLAPEEGLRGETPLPRFPHTPAHGNEKHIGFIILD